MLLNSDISIHWNWKSSFFGDIILSASMKRNHYCLNAVACFIRTKSLKFVLILDIFVFYYKPSFFLFINTAFLDCSAVLRKYDPRDTLPNAIELNVKVYLKNSKCL